MINKINYYFSEHFRRFFRFSMIGSLSAFTHILAVILLVEFCKLAPLTANIFGFLISFIISFYGHYQWTFSQTRTQGSYHTTLPRFFLIAAFGFSTNQTLYYFLLNKMHFPYMPALIFVIGFIASMTYILSNFWAFR